jgi:hypothetical protein
MGNNNQNLKAVLDPDQYVFGPPGSGCGYFYHPAKIVRLFIFEK